MPHPGAPAHVPLPGPPARSVVVAVFLAGLVVLLVLVLLVLIVMIVLVLLVFIAMVILVVVAVVVAAVGVAAAAVSILAVTIVGFVAAVFVGFVIVVGFAVTAIITVAIAVLFIRVIGAALIAGGRAAGAARRVAASTALIAGGWAVTAGIAGVAGGRAIAALALCSVVAVVGALAELAGVVAAAHLPDVLANGLLDELEALLGLLDLLGGLAFGLLAGLVEGIFHAVELLNEASGGAAVVRHATMGLALILSLTPFGPFVIAISPLPTRIALRPLGAVAVLGATAAAPGGLLVQLLLEPLNPLTVPLYMCTELPALLRGEVLLHQILHVAHLLAQRLQAAASSGVS